MKLHVCLREKKKRPIDKYINGHAIWIVKEQKEKTSCKSKRDVSVWISRFRSCISHYEFNQMCTVPYPTENGNKPNQNKSWQKILYALTWMLQILFIPMKRYMNTMPIIISIKYQTVRITL